MPHFHPPPDPKALTRRGRGAISNQSGRFETLQYRAFDDGWAGLEALSESPMRTQVSEDRSRTIIARNTSPDIPFDRSINPYRGCEHGCIYCFARPTHAWLGLSPGLDFETQLQMKKDAVPLLRAELAKPSYKVAPIAMGTNTDPYQPIERQHKITRSVLEVLAEVKHPVTIVTKSNLILRDMDILSQMAADGLASVMISVTSLDRRLSRIMEPRAPTPMRRLDAIAGLARAGIPVGVLTAPMIPALNDSEMEAIITQCHEVGARTAGYILLRLPLEIKDLFEEWLETHFPDRKNRLLNHIRQARGGQLYDSRFGHRLRGNGPYAELLKARFKLIERRLGLNENRPDLRRDLFTRPMRQADQLQLF
ncbi:MAG: PA0069 family radical SAM protein [Pseudomonadota bacterium]